MIDQFNEEWLSLIKKRFIDLDKISESDSPLFAHYTSLQAYEKIIIGENFLFSNPLLMNDTQELMFGLNLGRNLLENFQPDKNFLDKIGGKSEFSKILKNFIHLFDTYENSQLNNTYVLCFSEYNETDYPHGSLSLWREYGAKGQGAALVFDKNFLKYNKASTLLFSKVKYASDNNRKGLLKKVYIKIFDNIKNSTINEKYLKLAGQVLFSLTLLFSLLHKNNAFAEEKEWRLIYLPIFDPEQKFRDKFTYLVINNTMQPRLDFKIEPLDTNPDNDFTFDNALHRILLGPSHTSPLAFEATKNMLRKLGKEHLIKKLRASEIPYRTKPGN